MKLELNIVAIQTILGAGDGIRTHDILLGKQTLCQLSYTRTPPIVAPALCMSPERLSANSQHILSLLRVDDFPISNI